MAKALFYLYSRTSHLGISYESKTYLGVIPANQQKLGIANGGGPGRLVAFSLRGHLLLQGHPYQNLTLCLLLRPQSGGLLNYCEGKTPLNTLPFEFPHKRPILKSDRENGVLFFF